MPDSQKQLEGRIKIAIALSAAILVALCLALFLHFELTIVAAFVIVAAALLVVLQFDALKKYSQFLPVPVIQEEKAAVLKHNLSPSALPPEAMDKLRARVRAVFESVPVGLVITDSNGSIESVNSSFERIFQTSGSAVAGTPLRSVLPLSDDQLGELFASAPGQKRIEVETVTSIGEPLTVEVALCRLVTAKTNETNWLASIEDVSQRHEIERMKQEYVALVMHDLRNPLASLSAIHEMLDMEACGPLPASAHDSVQVAQRSTKRLLNLVNNLLDIKKLEAGQIELTIEAVPVGQLVRDSVEALQQFAAQYDIKLEAVPVNLQISCDADSIVQVLVNLISNAIKFSPKSSVVRIEAIPTNDFVEFRVSDTGRGIAKENLERIFQPYVQIKETRERKIKGTGLGLQICKSFVEQHGGQIGVSSELGSGSTFWFRLPLTAPELTPTS